MIHFQLANQKRDLNHLFDNSNLLFQFLPDWKSVVQGRFWDCAFEVRHRSRWSKLFLYQNLHQAVSVSNLKKSNWKCAIYQVMSFTYLESKLTNENLRRFDLSSLFLFVLYRFLLFVVFVSPIQFDNAEYRESLNRHTHLNIQCKPEGHRKYTESIPEVHLKSYLECNDRPYRDIQKTGRPQLTIFSFVNLSNLLWIETLLV